MYPLAVAGMPQVLAVNNTTDMFFLAVLVTSLVSFVWFPVSWLYIDDCFFFCTTYSVVLVSSKEILLYF